MGKNMLAICFFQSIIFINLLLSFNYASGDLANSDLKVLVSESDLIIVGTVVSLRSDPIILGKTRDPSCNAHAELTNLKTIKGKYDSDKISICWGDEIHDQSLNRLYESRLLFLKKLKGKYQGTHYGRSYWPIKVAADGIKQVTPYIYPITTVMLPKGLLKVSEVFFEEIFEKKRVQVINFEDLKSFINKSQFP